MPFVRVHGKQLALVHGVRREGTVAQDILFTFYGRDEVDAALGADAPRFRALLTERYPRIRFDWPRLDTQLRTLRDALPDTYASPEDRQRKAFRGALVDLTRQVLLLDPVQDGDAASLLRAHAAELDLLESWVRRLRREAAMKRDTPSDTPTTWRFVSTPESIPAAVEEELTTLLDRAEWSALLPRLHLLLEAFPTYAEGHTTLGIAALRQGQVATAERHFHDAAEVARAALPKRVPPALWTEPVAAPYIRALAWRSLALNRAGDHEGALTVATTLAACGDPPVAAVRQTVALLNLGRAAEARTHSARHTERYLAGFADLSDRRPKEARDTLVAALLAEPRIAQHLAGLRVPPAVSRPEAAEDTHAAALLVDLAPYLGAPGNLVGPTLRDLLKNPRIASIVSLRHTLEAEARHDRTRIEKIEEMKAPAFAAKVQDELRRAMAAQLL